MLEKKKKYFQYTVLVVYFLTFNLFQGICGENTASKYSISRNEQDEYAIRSYTLSKQAVESGVFKDEIVPVEIPQKKGKYSES